MAIDISSLSEYVKIYPSLLLNNFYENLTIANANVYDVSGIVPGKFSARFLDVKGNLQQCCTVPTNSDKVAERVSKAVCIMDGEDYCEVDLSAVLSNAVAEADRVRFTAGKENAGSVEQIITEAHINAFVEALETLSWVGDVTSPDSNLNKADGLITIAEADGAKQVDVTSGSAFDVINKGIRALPARARKLASRYGIGVFVPEELAESYWEVAMFLNLYHYNPGDFDYGSRTYRNVIGKTNIKIIPTPGLNGTGKVLITPIKNVVWFYNRKDDHNTLDWDYDKYRQLYFWRIKTIFGVNLVYPDLAVVVTFDESILETDPAITIKTDPKGANGGLLTDTTAAAARAASLSAPATAKASTSKARTAKASTSKARTAKASTAKANNESEKTVVESNQTE